MDVVVYAPGRGRGHTSRAAAVVRRLDAECVVLLTGASTQPLDAHGIPWRRVEYAEAAPAIDELAPRVLVVDCFPRGREGELARAFDSWPAAKVLLWRPLTRPSRAGLTRPAERGYDRVLVIEGGGGSVGVDCEPVLLRDAEELLPRDEARRVLGVADEPAVVVARSHHGGDALARLLAEVDARLLSPTHYPLLELMNGIDGLVGTAGYNLFHEARACGVPARWTWAERSIDQMHRCPDPVRDPADLAKWIAGIEPRHGARADYRNGAATAAWHIARLLR